MQERETQMFRSQCWVVLLWSVGVLRDSLTEKRQDSHIFRGLEIHYTVTRSSGTVMVGQCVLATWKDTQDQTIPDLYLWWGKNNRISSIDLNISEATYPSVIQQM